MQKHQTVGKYHYLHCAYFISRTTFLGSHSITKEYDLQYDLQHFRVQSFIYSNEYRDRSHSE